ncbi:hypothetical protein [Natribacillus halophilus]|uniref:Transposase/invertase (TIGR01784 family) n=1 Tax=Natribacillus halophilus TaxID=549003 RepID=A0A1G8SRA2_9BACI|nr:hypothetical protein [Natribacillus halophilus]SDJ31766.1 conserved hypothetical protein (putative transposase or invertase) [Natribacillus halophilus]
MDPVIRKAEERLEKLSGDAETRRLYEAREESMLERNSLIAEGEEKGEKRGLKKGREEGEEKGERRGLEKGRKEVVFSMLKEGVKPKEIARITGLDEDWVSKLADDYESRPK